MFGSIESVTNSKAIKDFTSVDHTIWCTSEMLKIQISI